MNGSISKVIEGVFKNDRKIINVKWKFASLKNSICSKILVIKIIMKNIKNVLKKDFKKRLKRNLLYVFIILDISIC